MKPYQIADAVKAPYEKAYDEAHNAWVFALKYGKKAEQVETRRALDIAHAVAVAVDKALFEAQFLATTEALAN